MITLDMGFHAALAAPGRSPEISEASDLNAWLVGDSDHDDLRYWVDVSDRGLKGELHCGWVLEGRAVQDVWVMPPRAERTGEPDRSLDMYGTTLRIWDPSIDAWRIRWHNPVANQHIEQIGRRVGKDVVQIGARPDGVPTRWMFTEISPDSFRWTGEALSPDGRGWALEGEFRARRR